MKPIALAIVFGSVVLTLIAAAIVLFSWIF